MRVAPRRGEAAQCRDGVVLHDDVQVALDAGMVPEQAGRCRVQRRRDGQVELVGHHLPFADDGWLTDDLGGRGCCSRHILCRKMKSRQKANQIRNVKRYADCRYHTTAEVEMNGTIIGMSVTIYKMF